MWEAACDRALNGLCVCEHVFVDSVGRSRIYPSKMITLSFSVCHCGRGGRCSRSASFDPLSSFPSRSVFRPGLIERSPLPGDSRDSRVIVSLAPGPDVPASLMAYFILPDELSSLLSFFDFLFSRVIMYSCISNVSDSKDRC